MTNMTEIYRGVAHSWLCDHQGHLNTRHYVAMFDDAVLHFLSLTGFTRLADKEEQKGWADVRNVLEYKHEVSAGALVTINAGLKKVGTKSITVYQEMRSTETGDLHASMEATLVRFDLSSRSAIKITDELREKADSFFIDEE